MQCEEDDDDDLTCYLACQFCELSIHCLHVPLIAQHTLRLYGVMKLCGVVCYGMWCVVWSGVVWRDIVHTVP